MEVDQEIDCLMAGGKTIRINGMEKPLRCVRPWCNNCRGCRMSYYPLLEIYAGNRRKKQNTVKRLRL